MKVQLLHSNLILFLSHAVADMLSGLDLPFRHPSINGQRAHRRIPTAFENFAVAYQTNACTSSNDDSVQQIQAQWNVPSISEPPYVTGAGEWRMYQGVAVDGYGQCPGVMALGGVAASLTVDAGGASSTQISGYYQYIPGPFNVFKTAVSVGDSVQITINTAAIPPTFTFGNLSSNQTETVQVSTNDTALCGQMASFFVSDPGTADDLDPFGAFPDFTMTGCSVSFNSSNCSLDSSNVEQMIQNGTLLASATVQSSTNLLFQYGG